MSDSTIQKFQNQTNKRILDFPVVGIGASAGGLEALQEFFKNLPIRPGAAFVIVQHLSPDYKSLMDELLARYTSMKIHKVTDGIEIQLNHIYLIPPRMNMTVFHGKLFLTEHEATRTLNLPIDIFFRSLAKDQEKNAIAIILSGTGSDGTLGIRAIKEYGGMTMVQDDKTAKFDGMPKSSISTGLVDFILSPNKLAEELVEYIKHPLIKQKKSTETLLNSNINQLTKVIAILRDAQGVDFSSYKENTIIRRLEKRISINRYTDFDDYVKFLNHNTREINVLFNELLIGVTRFFRDEEAFRSLKIKVLKPLLEKSIKEKDIRMWIPGCSTGEEAYSIAILLKELMAELKISREIKIFATDIDTHSLEFAGQGIFPNNIATDVTPDKLSRYFAKRESGFQIKENIRSMIIFARHNLLTDPPFSKIDLISCRNLLIYLNVESQQHVLNTFLNSLNKSGALFLGSSESLGGMAAGFNTIDSKNKIFRRDPSYQPRLIGGLEHSLTFKTKGDLKSVSTFVKTNRPKQGSLDSVFDEILGEFVPPSVIINENLEIVHTIHNVQNFVSLPVGEISLNLLRMLPKEINVLVNSLIRRADKKQIDTVLKDVKWKDIDELITISCKKIIHNKTNEIYYMVSFKKQETIQVKTAYTEKLDSVNINEQYKERIEELEKELQFKSESLQATVEELETSNEELQSSNEELIASNEELQSTNEELQSVNEELYTVNSEHIRKIEELSELYADVDNLLSNTNIGTLYLDKNLTIRKVNDTASKITNVLDSDIGRPLNHLSMVNIYSEFMNDIASVISTLIPKEKELELPSKNWYLMSIVPYRTAENAVEGIIITFVNVTKLKKEQQKSTELNKRLELALEGGKMSWWEWDVQSNTVKTGKQKYSMLGYSAREIGKGFEAWTKLLHPDDFKRVMQNMQDHLDSKSDSYDVEYRIKSKAGNYVWYHDKGSVVCRNEKNKPQKVTGIVINITNKKQLEESFSTELNVANNNIASISSKRDILFNTISQGIVFQNKNGEIIDANPTAEKILGVGLTEMQKRTSDTPEWKPLCEDKTEFPGKEHPAMLALKTGEKIENVIMGVYNPKKNKYVWINITAIPLFNTNEKLPSEVYTIFTEI